MPLIDKDGDLEIVFSFYLNPISINYVFVVFRVSLLAINHLLTDSRFRFNAKSTVLKSSLANVR